MEVCKSAYAGNEYVGLYAKASDSFALIPKSSPQKFEERAKCLNAKIVKASVCGSAYLGVYTAANSKGVLASPLCDEKEVKEIKEEGIEINVLQDTRFCAVGNNVACNSNGAIANPDMPREAVKEIEHALGVEVVQMEVAGYRAVGMMVVPTDGGWIAHNRITDEEAEKFEQIFKVKGGNGTVNSGTPFVGIGMVANSKAAIVGEETSGFELGRIEQALNLID
ncbi:translation initiation factor IF-6 [Candidatus Micrarchaeota archaeon CG10_big_fil_rev_8_21_14_0_10_45_29]|nr:MAG: translation initiation factor IF-6 [Candidatus Micrarchaeota archaeon CG10_big_fil_rev_8_21_14_0_10_45_29]